MRLCFVPCYAANMCQKILYIGAPLNVCKYSIKLSVSVCPSPAPPPASNVADITDLFRCLTSDVFDKTCLQTSSVET